MAYWLSDSVNFKLQFPCKYLQYAGRLVSNSGTKLTIQNIYTNTTIFNRFFCSVHITFPDSLQSNFQLPSAYPQVLQSPSQCLHSDGRAVTYYRACYSESPNSHWAKLSLTGDIMGNHWMLIGEKQNFFLHPPRLGGGNRLPPSPDGHIALYVLFVLCLYHCVCVREASPTCHSGSTETRPAGDSVTPEGLTPETVLTVCDCHCNTNTLCYTSRYPPPLSVTAVIST